MNVHKFPYYISLIYTSVATRLFNFCAPSNIPNTQEDNSLPMVSPCWDLSVLTSMHHVPTSEDQNQAYSSYLCPALNSKSSVHTCY